VQPAKPLDGMKGPAPSQEGNLGDGTGDLIPQSKYALQLAAKPLQAADLILKTVYRNSTTPYPTVPSPAPMTSSSPIWGSELPTKICIANGGQTR